jgi:hypothetical protein
MASKNGILRRRNGFVHSGNGQLVKTKSIMSGISVSGDQNDRYYPVFTPFFQVFIALKTSEAMLSTSAAV